MEDDRKLVEDDWPNSKNNTKEASLTLDNAENIGEPAPPSAETPPPPTRSNPVEGDQVEIPTMHDGDKGRALLASPARMFKLTILYSMVQWEQYLLRKLWVAIWL